jgi:hypothetical protein
MYSIHGVYGKSYKRLVGRLECKIPLQRLDADKNIMKADCREVGYGVSAFGLLAGLVNTVMSLQVPKKAEYFLTS